ncbi:hypothetical protein MKK88_20700 [Methylobacterium sp. E-005]|uniref:hypothetical protein n=1 Tax=Methylobacterium sp. E-005 TaxID=2836549 RepID=UPI001FBA15FE|nr:hypothetical protein [Methylobacterium sp. E-005]MCJ2088387.1 hypothetical protein [Methylobacterium sp. E-005]
MMPSRIVPALALAAGLTTGPVLAQGETTCPRDLLVAQSMQRQAIDQLEQADGDETKNCRIWRRHVETMRRVAGVYGRCLSGSERGERLAQVQGSDREFSAAIKARCRGN